jgi:hypothetical protein
LVVVLDVHVLAAPDLALGLVLLLVVREEYQGKRLACPLLQRPGGAAPSETQSEAIRGHQEAIKRQLTPLTCSRRSCSAAAMARCASRLRLA